MFKYAFASLLGLAALTAPASASASVTFAMTGNDAINGSFGNAHSFTASGVNVRVSGWRATASGGNWAAESAYVARYGNGLGVTATGDSNGNNNLHTLDNLNGFDFVLLQFDRAVRLTGATLNRYSVGGSSDNDAFVAAGLTALPWNTTINLAGNAALLNTLIGNGTSIKSGAGLPADRSFASYNQWGNVWIVGADLFNTDGADGFKMANLLVTAPVPEPATWAMMIAGFGAVGFAARRRRAPTAVLA